MPTSECGTWSWQVCIYIRKSTKKCNNCYILVEKGVIFKFLAPKLCYQYKQFMQNISLGKYSQLQLWWRASSGCILAYFLHSCYFAATTAYHCCYCLNSFFMGHLILETVLVASQQQLRICFFSVYLPLLLPFCILAIIDAVHKFKVEV